jgi:putative acetyltransferase
MLRLLRTERSGDDWRRARTIPVRISIGSMIVIRDELPQDISAIHNLNVWAFGGPAEAVLVDRLRAAGKALISRVATLDGRVVGHILFSPITVERSPSSFRGLGLAPMSVLPEFQNRGIGSILVRDGLEICRQGRYDLVVVLGHLRFYPRFGFSRAKDYGLENEYKAVDEFMVIELREGALKAAAGLVKYASEFRDVGV